MSVRLNEDDGVPYIKESHPDQIVHQDAERRIVHRTSYEFGGEKDSD